MGRLMTVLSALVCMGAGLYLLQYNEATSRALGGGTSWFQIIGHGMGIYFIGKGLFVGRSLFIAETQNENLERLVFLLSDDEPEAPTVEPAPVD